MPDSTAQELRTRASRLVDQVLAARAAIETGDLVMAREHMNDVSRNSASLHDRLATIIKTTGRKL